jgi:ATP-dependent DNA helicase RecQ
VSPEDDDLFERLRALRKQLADEQGVPAYVVFSDATLREMAAVKPTSEGQLLAINGVGPVKFERYGDAFLDVMRNAE